MKKDNNDSKYTQPIWLLAAILGVFVGYKYFFPKLVDFLGLKGIADQTQAEIDRLKLQKQVEANPAPAANGVVLTAHDYVNDAAMIRHAFGFQKGEVSYSEDEKAAAKVLKKHTALSFINLETAYNQQPDFSWFGGAYTHEFDLRKDMVKYMDSELDELYYLLQ